MSMQGPCPPVGKLHFVKGEEVDVSQVVASGRPVILEFWATWCPPCRDSVPHVTELQHKYPDAVFIGVTSSDPPAKAKKFADSQGAKMDYRVACDTEGATDALQAQYQVSGIPHAFVVTHENLVTFSGHPMDPTFETAVRAACAQAKSARKTDVSKLAEEDIATMSVKQLKTILAEHDVPRSQVLQCIEKRELVDKVLALR